MALFTVCALNCCTHAASYLLMMRLAAEFHNFWNMFKSLRHEKTRGEKQRKGR